MNFKQFLNESMYGGNHSTKIDIEKAKKILKEKCKNSDFKKPIWRGSKSGIAEAYILEGQNGGRLSANTSNHYTLILDEQIKEFKDYPMRSKSIIMGTNKHKSYVAEFGDLYAVFPYDDTNIGVCPDEDIWFTETAINESFEYVNGIFNNLDVPDKSFNSIVSYIESNEETIKGHTGDDVETKKFIEFVYSGKSVKEQLLKMYDLKECGFNFIKSKDMSKYQDKGLELWIGGPCIAISENVWNELVHDKFSI